MNSCGCIWPSTRETRHDDQDNLLLITAAGLTGCAVYPATPYGEVYEPAPVYVAPAPVLIGGAMHFGHQRGYSRPPEHPHGHHSHLRPHAPPRPHLHRPGRHHH